MRKAYIIGVLLVAVLVVLGACAPAVTEQEEVAASIEEAILPKEVEEEVVPEPTPASEETLAPTAEPALITKDASEIVLRLEDLGSIEEGVTQHGWSQTEASPTIKMVHEGVESTYGVRFYREEWLGWATHQKSILNEVAVFPSIELAHQAYKENESGLVVDTSDPYIGDESWWYVGVGQSITFRKGNVLVQIHLTFAADIKSYAMIIEERISQ